MSTRALALTRFKRNHEQLAEIFAVNAIGKSLSEHSCVFTELVF